MEVIITKAKVNDCECVGKCDCWWDKILTKANNKSYNIISIKSSQHEDIIQLGQLVFDENVPDRIGGLVESEIQHQDIQKNSEKVRLFASKTAKILLHHGFQIDPNVYCLWFQSYNINSVNPEKYFGWHVDDNADDYGHVHTAILYLNKDKTINGGNLLYYQHPWKYTIVVKSETMILMDGRILHKPENISGIGNRDSIVIRFMRI